MRSRLFLYSPRLVLYSYLPSKLSRSWLNFNKNLWFDTNEFSSGIKFDHVRLWTPFKQKCSLPIYNSGYFIQINNIYTTYFYKFRARSNWTRIAQKNVAEINFIIIFLINLFVRSFVYTVLRAQSTVTEWEYTKNTNNHNNN